MGDTLKRIQETGATCIAAYEGWDGDKKDTKKREDLLDSLHEMRKAMARVEIEIATSDRGSSSSKHIPIPSHRSHSKSNDGGSESILPAHDDNASPRPAKKSGGRRPRTRKSND
ncbi:MAG: hypothetical protein AAF988_05105 [Pseudomonadota bacterium]